MKVITSHYTGTSTFKQIAFLSVGYKIKMCSWTDQKFLMPLFFVCFDWAQPSALSTVMLRVKQIIHEHIQQKYTTNQQATTSMCNGVKSAVRSFISRKGSAAKKAWTDSVWVQRRLKRSIPRLFCSHFLHASLSYRHESNDFLFYTVDLLWFF